jgi:predicted SAM-dependent methyltransferase
MKRVMQWLRGARPAEQNAVSQPTPAGRFLNLGCGRRFHPDWCNVDIAPADPAVLAHDLTRPLPFSDGQFLAVYHSHVLEHLPKAGAPGFLAECLRVLEPGGILRVVVPDLETIARLYLANLDTGLGGDPDAVARHEWMTLELMDQLVRDRSGGEMLRYWRQNPMPAEEFVRTRMGREVEDILAQLRRPEGPPEPPPAPESPERAGRFRAGGEIHLWMYDRLSLGRLLESIGFVRAEVCTAQQSGIHGFDRFGLDLDRDGSIRKPDSLFMEAVKPL